MGFKFAFQIGVNVLKRKELKSVLVSDLEKQLKEGQLAFYHDKLRLEEEILECA